MVANPITIVLLSRWLLMILFIDLVVGELSNLENYIIWGVLVIALLFASEFAWYWVIVVIVVVVVVGMHHGGRSWRCYCLKSSTTACKDHSPIAAHLVVYVVMLHRFLIDWNLLTSSSLLWVVQWTREFILILILIYTSILIQPNSSSVSSITHIYVAVIVAIVIVTVVVPKAIYSRCCCSKWVRVSSNSIQSSINIWSRQRWILFSPGIWSFLSLSGKLIQLLMLCSSI